MVSFDNFICVDEKGDELITSLLEDKTLLSNGVLLFSFLAKVCQKIEETYKSGSNSSKYISNIITNLLVYCSIVTPESVLYIISFFFTLQGQNILD